MLTVLVGLATIAIFVAICYGIGRFIDSHEHPVEDGMKILIILGWILLISYGAGWIVLEALEPIL